MPISSLNRRARLRWVGALALVAAAAALGVASARTRAAAVKASAAVSAATSRAAPPAAPTTAPGAPAVILRDTVCIPQRDAGAPAELVPFVPAGSRALCSVAADLDRDGLYDWVMVTEPAHDDVGDSAVDDHPRTLLVLLRESGGALHQAVRNDRVVLCYGCGGSFDPFDALEAKAGMIKVYHFGGRGWRWRADYTFEYAPAVRTWRLAEVSEVEVHSGDPDNTMKQTRRGPRDFGEIDLAGFDPDMLLPPELR